MTTKDYSRTIFYVIKCRNPIITDQYVGHTIGFTNRKGIHKHDCNSPKTNHLKLYQTINANGGWDNWEMVEIEVFSCSNKTEARMREDYWVTRIQPTLNKNKAVILVKGKPLVLSDELSPQERNKANSGYRSESIKVELQDKLKLMEENEELKKEIMLLKSLVNMYLNKS